jgi:hypothetical protein
VCESWTLTRGGSQIEDIEDRVLRGLFGPKRKAVAGGWETLHNEELHNLYTLPNIIRVIKSRWMRWAGHGATMDEMRNACKILVEELEGTKALGRYRSR